MLSVLWAASGSASDILTYPTLEIHPLQTLEQTLNVESAAVFEALLSAVQAATLLNIHPNTLLLWARSGRVPCLRLGRRVMFRASSLDQWLAEHYTTSAVRAAQPERTAA